MTKIYHHLTLCQRAQIEFLHKKGYKITYIAKELGVNRSTVSRELKRNTCQIKKGYNANYAQERSQNKRKNASKQQIKIKGELKNIIISELKKTDPGPIQLAGFIKKKTEYNISHTSIYNFIKKDKENGGNLYKHLRFQGKKQKKRSYSKAGVRHIPDRVSIDERPAIVEEKSRIGDLEIDLIIGKGHCGAILSIVDRRSTYTKLVKLNGKTKREVTRAIIRTLKKYKGKIFTITSDNGSEFADHKIIAKKLCVQYYFCDPYSSWQRGLNEYRLILPKKYKI